MTSSTAPTRAQNAAARSVDRLTKGSAFSRIGSWVGMPVGIALLLVVGSLLSDRFLSIGNLTNVLINISILGVIVVGMTFVFITRGLADLSVPATVAVGAILVLGLQPTIGTIPAALVAILAALVAGVVNGLLIGYAGINPVITTLAVGTIVLGIAQWSVGGVIVYGTDPAAQAFLNGRVFGIPVIVMVFLAVAVIGHLVLSRTTLGRWVYAAGGNPDATRASAVPLFLTRGSAFVLTAGLAGLAGVLLGVTLQTARPGIGIGYEFDAITAVVVGGVSLLGGSGSIPRAIGGLLFVALLNNILVLQGVPTAVQGIAKGTLIVAAVSLDVYLRRKGGQS
ncbi:ABC transporter permease [Microbacterium sp. zg-Y818]|uniref:ABC transporter permease n=1 Tax=unclassified Microbacterium TaxID=2609290 RepID=UPI00214B0E69|nr:MULTISPECIES: ABC transporter permease [unclassified Microbacterium]MCR2800131.1 ABC transporter permease [Microbacterium sp. zg.Y818]WIM22102.1 ABC transporter permease [Microbacterium sp. zg-Y818]